MVNLSTQDVFLSIEKTPLVISHGIHYQEYNNFFGDSVPIQLTNLNETDFFKLEKQSHKPRLRVSYDADIMRRLKVFFMHTSITTALEKKFQTSLTFDSVDIWRDNAGYYLPPHTDDDRIKLALQIYLGDNNVGTSLYDEKGDIIKSFQYHTNSGYALLNNRFSRHGTTARVSHGERMSLYARYS